MQFMVPLLVVATSANIPQPQSDENDANAKAILDKVKAKYEAYQTMMIEFDQEIIPSDGSGKQTTPATLFLKGNKWRIEYPDQTLICNETTYWIHMIEENEVNISDYDADAEDVVKPSDIFKLYEKNFKYAINSPPTGKKGDETFDIIRFAPLDRDVFYHTIKLYVSQKDQSIERAVVIDKEQNQLVFRIRSLAPNVTILDSKFTFDASKYPGIIVNDTRR